MNATKRSVLRSGAAAVLLLGLLMTPSLAAQAAPATDLPPAWRRLCGQHWRLTA